MCNLKDKRRIQSEARKDFKIFFAWGFSINFVIFGIILITYWSKIYESIVNNMTVLKPESMAYEIWHKNPVPLSTKFFFYNWTNSEDIYNSSIKPKFQELGPYMFKEQKEKTNVIWNNNNTVTYKLKRTFWFDTDGSNGSLSDHVITINAVALTAAYRAQHWSYFAKKALSVSLSSIVREIPLKRTAGELLFEGYQDPFLSVVSKFSALSNNFPETDKFGWFYGKNGSETKDGIFNIKSGVNGQIGELNYWKLSDHTQYYPGDCGRVDKASAMDFYPRQMTNESVLKIFSSDLCRYIELEYEKDVIINGILGHKYSAGDKLLDNGTKIPENKCFCDGNCMPYGAVNVSNCRQGSPSFISLPHFFKADPSYLQGVDGIRPPTNNDNFYMVIEPNTGVPLKVAARVQLNLLLEPSNDIVLFRQTPTLFFPVIYFEQGFTLSTGKAVKIKILINFELICWIIGLTFIIIGLVITCYTFYKPKEKNINVDKERKDKYSENE